MSTLNVQLPEAFACLFEPKRTKVFYGGRGGAKSQSIGIFLLIRGMQSKIGVLCARELQVSIADSVHRLLSEIISQEPYLQAFYEIKQQQIVGKNGTWFAFKGVKHNANELKSYQGADYCWVEEAQSVSDKSWEILIPTIRKPNSELIISFNPKNPTDPTWQRFVLQKDEDTLVREVTWRDNPFFPEVLEKERLKLFKNDPEAYEHVWEGKFDTRYSGSVYAKFVNQAQIKAIPYYPDKPVNTAWDLGFDDATAIIFYQVAKNEISIIDYYEANFEDIKHYCEVLCGRQIIIDKREDETGRIVEWHFAEDLKEGAHRKAYDYSRGVHYAPHDAGYKLQAAGGRSIVEQAAEFGITLYVVPATGQQTSEQALRKALPHVWMDETRCKDLVHAVMQYHYEYDEDLKVYSKVPVHDWSSHGCFVANTEILTRHGTQQIMKLADKGEVLTRCGWKAYHSPRITRRNAQLVEVTFSDGLTVRCTPDHLFLTDSGWKSAESLRTGSVIQSTLTRSPSTSMAGYIDYGPATITFRVVANEFIGRCGAWLSALCQMVAISITKTITVSIICSPILNAFLPQSICLAPGTKLSTHDHLGSRLALMRRPLLGIDQTKDAYGTGDTWKRVKGAAYGSALIRPVLNAMWSLFALIGRATGQKRNGAALFARQLLIESVSHLSERADVWCLTVPDTGHFSLANGAIVHNCDALELMGRVWQTPPEAKPPPQPKWDIRADEQGRIQAGFTISDYLRKQEARRKADD